MFEGMKNMGQQFQRVQKLMQDENFKAFISHPKVQELFRDPEFKEIAKSKDFARISAYPKFAALMREPELAQRMAKINLKDIVGG